MDGNIFEYKKDGILLRFRGGACVECGGRVTGLSPGEEKEGISFIYDPVPCEKGLEIRTGIMNRSGRNVFVRSIEEVRIEGKEDISFPCPWEELQVMIQGRHKNDIPSVVILGRRDGNFTDASVGMTESGDVGKGAFNGCLVSDTLTLVKGGGSCLLMAFPEGHRYFCSSRIRPDAGEGDLLTAGCQPGVLLKDGQSLTGEPFVLRTGPSWQVLAEEWASDKERLLCGGRKKKKTPSVFCTWYYYGLTVTYKDAAENLEKIRERRLPYDVFQIDEGWEITLGEWEPNAKFPVPMKEAAARIREGGLIPGIWTSPFIAHESAGVWKKHPGWKLRGKDGKPVLFPMNSTVYQVLDITIPEVRDYVEDLYRKLTEDWGYVYHKLDFTRAAVIYEDAAGSIKRWPCRKPTAWPWRR